MVEIIEAQTWLENEYKDKQEKVSGILFKESTKELGGEIKINGQEMPALSDIKKIDLRRAKGITKLTISHCPNVESILLYGNPITEIVGLDKLLELIELNCGNTKINEVDISKNTKLREFHFHDNKQKIKIIGFRKIIKNLVVWNGFNGIAFPWEQILEEDLKEIAEELGIGEDKIKDKPIEEIKDIVKEKAGKLREIKDRVKKEIPGLIDDEDKINDNTLNELKELYENKDDVTKKIKDLERENEELKHHIETTQGEGKLQILLAQIEVKENNK